MTKYNFKYSILIYALFIALVSCNGNKNAGTAKVVTEFIPEDIVELRADQIRLANIDMGAIEIRSVSGTLKVSGKVATAPQDFATVCMPLGGFVKSISLMPGNAVRKGQTLAIIENQEFVDIQEHYLEAKSRLEYISAEYNRQDELYNKDVSSRKDMQQVTTDFKSIKAQVKALEQKLLLIGIDPVNLREENISSSVALTAPISGYINEVNINIGKYVSPSDILFGIINSDKLFLELTLFEKDAASVSNGQKIHFFINNETEQHVATIYQTGKSINSDKTYTVYASVQSDCRNVIPGMYVNAVIEGESNKVTAVPSDAIVSFDDKDYIFIYERDKEEEGNPFTEYRMIKVQKGITDSGYTEIVLPEGFEIDKTKVVVKGAYNLLSAKKNAGEMAC
ncbi:MAG TPA: efflux RND transporter periplasmic adaptor subunit [Bacteroidales bacterium]|nr:efflux RND transporter periplasmic adaptor subunit [Bacteroidales bacterium]HPT21362.1 efflux RND transporter periplasmic adaptor subunit [Bacteroidales bacterium]